MKELQDYLLEQVNEQVKVSKTAPISVDATIGSVNVYDLAESMLMNDVTLLNQLERIGFYPSKGNIIAVKKPKPGTFVVILTDEQYGREVSVQLSTMYKIGNIREMPD